MLDNARSPLCLPCPVVVYRAGTKHARDPIRWLTAEREGTGQGETVSSALLEKQRELDNAGASRTTETSHPTLSIGPSNRSVEYPRERGGAGGGDAGFRGKLFMRGNTGRNLRMRGARYCSASIELCSNRGENLH